MATISTDSPRRERIDAARQTLRQWADRFAEVGDSDAAAACITISNNRLGLDRLDPLASEIIDCARAACETGGEAGELCRELGTPCERCEIDRSELEQATDEFAYAAADRDRNRERRRERRHVLGDLFPTDLRPRRSS